MAEDKTRNFSMIALIAFNITLAGYLAVSWIADAPNRRLISDLPLLQNLDKYERVGDVEFIKKLYQLGLFSNDEEFDLVPAAGPTIAQNSRTYVANLTPSEKAELLRKQDRFAGLEPAKQNQLRQIYEQIKKDEHSDELFGVMRRYYEWLKKSLPSYSRTELNELTSVDDRINWIKKQRKAELERNVGKVPTGKDAKTFLTWMEGFAAKNETQFLEKLPQNIKKRFASANESTRHRAVMLMIWMRQRSGSSKITPSESDVAELMEKLSADSRKRLEAMKSGERMRTIQNWAHDLLWQMVTGRGGGEFSLFDEEQLVDFFENGLTNEQRDKLMALPGEEMQRELLKLYFMQIRATDPSQRRPDDMPPPEPQGGEFNPPPE